MATHRLSASAEAALISEMRTSANTSSAWASLEKAFQPLLTSYANQVECNAFQRDEVQQEMRLAFFHAVRKHDLSRGDRLATLAHRYLKGAVNRTRKRFQGQNKSISLDNLVEQAELSGDEHYLSDLGEAAAGITRSIMVQDGVIPAVRQFINSRPTAQRRLALRIVDFGENESEAAVSLGVSRQAASRTWLRLVAAGRTELRQYA